MKPIEFPEANTVLNKPDEMTDEECMPLPVCVCRDSEDLPLIISCWEPTPEEWDTLRKQGRIYIAIVSEEYHPPLILFPGNPFDQVEAILDDPYTDEPATITDERIKEINDAIINLDKPLKHPVLDPIQKQPNENCSACGGEGILEDDDGRIYNCFCTNPTNSDKPNDN